MAKAKPTSILQGICGRLSARDDTVFRIRNGINEVYTIDNSNRAPMTPNQARTAGEFRQRTKLASIINRDPQLSAPFLAAYKSLSSPSRFPTLYHYILSRLISDAATFSRYMHLLPDSAPPNSSASSS